MPKKNRKSHGRGVPEKLPVCRCAPLCEKVSWEDPQIFPAYRDQNQIPLRMLRAQAESILNGYSLKALLDVVVAVVGVVAVFFHHDGKAHGVHLRVFAAG